MCTITARKVALEAAEHLGIPYSTSYTVARGIAERLRLGERRTHSYRMDSAQIAEAVLIAPSKSLGGSDPCAVAAIIRLNGIHQVLSDMIESDHEALADSHIAIDRKGRARWVYAESESPETATRLPETEIGYGDFGAEKPSGPAFILDGAKITAMVAAL
ncbi:MAG: hypothetical protein AAF674_12705 [Pseudomonadota bacterium]